MSRLAHLLVWFIVAGLSLTLFAACATKVEVSQTEPVALDDPNESGPYAVGVARFSFERTSSTTGEPRDLDTIVWYPASGEVEAAATETSLGAVTDLAPATDGAPFPIVVWSHGAGGSEPYAPLYFALNLASHGFVVIAPSHPGNLRDDCFGSGRGGCTAEGMADSYANRLDDLTFALDSVLKLNEDPGSLLYSLLDASRVGVAGHSFGGTDTVREAATTPGSPFIAALAMAPCVGAVVPSPDNVEMPLMMMGGDRDTRCPSADQQTYFDGISGSPAFLLIFPRGGHSAYGDQCPAPVAELACGPNDLSQDKAHQLINFYGTAFFKTYLAGDRGYEVFLDPAFNSAETEIRYRAAGLP